MARVMTPEMGIGTNGPTVTILEVKGVCFGEVLSVPRVIHPIVMGKK